jgi:hypothetical protein
MSVFKSYCSNYGDKLNLTIKSLFRYLEILGPVVIYIYIYIYYFDASFLLWVFVSTLTFAVQHLTSYLHTTMEITTEKNTNFLGTGKILTNK